MEKFRKLGLSKEVTDVLQKSGFREPSEIQEKAIPIALAGKDIIGGSATGSGKTLAFAAPILENLKPNRQIQSIILTPTRELAEQVATSIRDFGKNKTLNVLAVYGGVRIDTQMRKLSTTDVLVGTPGRILDHLNRGTLRLNHIKILVLDEVDRMFDMGFSKDVERIIKECPEKRQTMMFSATVSADINYLAKKYTNKPIEIAVKSHVDPLKLKQIYYDVTSNQKFSLLVHLLKQEKSDFVLVFCSTRRNVDFVTENLIKVGIHAHAIHGGLEQKKRLRVLDEFKKKGIGILVCTDVAARGLDIEAVSHVYNYDLPTEAKDYIHRIGRTARAGKNGIAINIVASRDYERFGAVMNLDSVNITPEKLPQFERVIIRIDNKRDPRNNSRSRNNNEYKPRRSGNPRQNSSRSYGSNRDGPRRPSRGSSSSRDNSRRPSSGRSYSSNRDGPRRPSRGHISSRDNPRGDNRSRRNNNYSKRR